MMSWVMIVIVALDFQDGHPVTHQFKVKGFESVDQCMAVRKDVAKMIRAQDSETNSKPVLICLPDPSTAKKKGTTT